MKRMGQKLLKITSPSSRRAWIEIQIGMLSMHQYLSVALLAEGVD